MTEKRNQSAAFVTREYESYRDFLEIGRLNFAICTSQRDASWLANEIELLVTSEWQLAYRFSPKLVDIQE